jgi:hypothetical protein
MNPKRDQECAVRMLGLSAVAHRPPVWCVLLPGQECTTVKQRYGGSIHLITVPAQHSLASVYASRQKYARRAPPDEGFWKSSNHRTDGPGGLAIARPDQAPALPTGRITSNVSQAPPQWQFDTVMQTIPLGQ